MKRNETNLISPFGRAVFAFLNRPSFKFDKAAGAFTLRLHLDESPETAEFIRQVDDLYERAAVDAVEAILEDKPRADVSVDTIKRADRPYKPAEDPDTGEPIPGYTVSAKLKYRVLRKNEDTGRMEVAYTQRPILQDSKLNPVTDEIGSGTEMRMSVRASTFYTASIGAGVSLRLLGVQVKSLIAPGMGDPGFEEVEGYEARPQPEPQVVSVEEDESEAEDSPAQAAKW